VICPLSIPAVYPVGIFHPPTLIEMMFVYCSVAPLPLVWRINSLVLV
jgi:hypothetical protein